MLRTLGLVLMLWGAMGITSCNSSTDSRLPEEYLGEWEFDANLTKTAAEEIDKDSKDLPRRNQALLQGSTQNDEGTRVEIKPRELKLSSVIRRISTDFTITRVQKTPSGQLYCYGTVVGTSDGKEYSTDGSFWLRREGEAIWLITGPAEEDGAGARPGQAAPEPGRRKPMVLVRAKAGR